MQSKQKSVTKSDTSLLIYRKKQFKHVYIIHLSEMIQTKQRFFKVNWTYVGNTDPN